MSDLTGLTPGVAVLLQGNQALARGALEAGVALAAAYPGNPSSEILESLADSAASAGFHAEWSANEKVALESAAAASFAGVRGLASMKQNGVNVCLDFIHNLAISGCRGGLVLVTCDDPSGVSSTNEEDARFVARLADLPLIEPATPAQCLALMKYAFELSEAIGQLVVLRSLSRLSHTRAAVTPGQLPTSRPRPNWDPADPAQRWATLPVVPRHRVMKQKLQQAGQLMAQAGLNQYQGPEKPELVIVASGSSVLYAQEAIGLVGAAARVGLLSLAGTWPLPADILARHLEGAKQVLFAEEIDPFIETEVKAWAAQQGGALAGLSFHGKADGSLPEVGELTPGLVAAALAGCLGGSWRSAEAGYLERARAAVEAQAPIREVGFCPGCPHRASFWAIKQALAVDGRQGIVSGDIGCYTMGHRPTGFQRVNSVHCMGSGLGVASGLGQLKPQGFDQPVVAVVGDSTFYHAGLPALVNARWNQSDYLLIILDNSATAMTGFQPHPGTGLTASGQAGQAVELEKVCQALGLTVEVADPYDLEATQAAIYNAVRQGGLKVLILRRVCALVQGRRGGHPFKMRIDTAKCRGEACGCNRFCSRVFRCPGLYYDEKAGRAAIDEVVCVGCGVCRQICPAGAILAEGEGEAAA